MELDKDIFALRLKRAAIAYDELFNFNLSPINGMPNEDNQSAREKSFKKPVSMDDALSRNLSSNYDWREATGIGVNLGYDNLWALDIDNLPEEAIKRDETISNIIYLLRLPKDYEWVVNSGGGKGIHIIFKSQPLDDSKSEIEVVNFNSDQTKITMGLRMKSFLVLPPSLHSSGKEYVFRSQQSPKESPRFVSIDSLYALFEHYYGCFETLSIWADNYVCTLQRTAIIQQWGWDNYGSHVEYEFYDEIPFLSSCHNPKALNSLGCLYFKKAFDSLRDQNMYLNLAFQCFKESGNWEANSNILAVKAIQESRNNRDVYRPLQRFGDYRYLYLSRRKYKYLFFDTETTGIPLRNDASYKDVSNWPRLVQLSWLCVDEDGSVIAQEKCFIRPDGFSIPEESTKIHGITNQDAIECGEDLVTVLRVFGDCAHYAQYIVGHNVDYDMNIIRSEMLRPYNKPYNMRDEIDFTVDSHDYSVKESWEYDQEKPYTYLDVLNELPTIDTMKSSVDLCRIPGKYGYKYPKLQELYSYLFGRNFVNAHDSMADIKATLECFNELKRRGIITE